MRTLTYYVPASGFDADALAYLTAAGISAPIIRAAIDTLVKALKAAGLWVKFKALYPFPLANSAANAVNMKSPGTYNQTFFGSPPHLSTETDWNGTTQYSDTGLNPSIALTRFSHHLSYYTREAVTESNTSGQGVMGCGTSGTSEILLSVNRGNKHIYWANSDTAAVTDTNASPQNGFFIGTRTSSTAAAVYRNGTQEATSTVTDTGTLPNATVYLGRGPGAFAVSSCSFASIGDGLTSAEALAFYNAVQAYQTTLSRQV
jgi:hypothetical protein